MTNLLRFNVVSGLLKERSFLKQKGIGPRGSTLRPKIKSKKICCDSNKRNKIPRPNIKRQEPLLDSPRALYGVFYNWCWEYVVRDAMQSVKNKFDSTGGDT